MLKLASPVRSLVSSHHFIGLPLVGPEAMSWELSIGHRPNLPGEKE